MIYILIQAVQILSQLFVLVVIVDAVLSFFMSPYHPVRATLDRLVSPFLEPIRRVVPLIGMIDFSPLVLIILVQLISGLLINFLLLLR